MDDLGGKLLVAGATLFDPNFRRAVVLIGHHDDDGAVGVILNRPLDVAVDEAVPPLARLVAPGEPLFQGGPVEPEAAVVIAEFEDPSKAGVLAIGSVGFLPEESDPEELGGILRARVFSGYAGWGSGQLEMELGEEAWLVAPAQPDDIFQDDPDVLWRRVLDRLGPRYAMMSTMPIDPGLN